MQDRGIADHLQVLVHVALGVSAIYEAIALSLLLKENEHGTNLLRAVGTNFSHYSLHIRKEVIALCNF